MPLAPLILVYLAPFMWLTIVGAACHLPSPSQTYNGHGAPDD